jgi:hypothetical protein
VVKDPNQPSAFPPQPANPMDLFRELSKVTLPLDPSEPPDYVLDLLQRAGLPLTRENYLGRAYPEGVPEDLDESSLPSEIRIG